MRSFRSGFHFVAVNIGFVSLGWVRCEYICVMLAVLMLKVLVIWAR
jgi:hypothetical protein